VLSAVPIRQELGRRIDLDRYREWLLRLDFATARPVLDRFWLKRPPDASVTERARLVVARLGQGKLIWLESRDRVHDCKDRMVRLQHAEHRLVDVRVAPPAGRRAAHRFRRREPRPGLAKGCVGNAANHESVPRRCSFEHSNERAAYRMRLECHAAGIAINA
jgi:hypothetical protein